MNKKVYAGPNCPVAQSLYKPGDLCTSMTKKKKANPKFYV